MRNLKTISLHSKIDTKIMGTKMIIKKLKVNLYNLIKLILSNRY